MRHVQALAFVTALGVALTPFAALAQDNTPEHQQAELANGFAQWDQAQQQVQDLQAEASRAAQNERMIAVIKSESMRELRLNNIANGNALEQIAASLAAAARSDGEVNARNSLAIAQNKAAALLVNVEANLANARMLAQTKGRVDELANAQAQADILHRIADFISGQLAETNMANDRAIGQNQADALHTPGIAAAQNGM